MKKKHTDCNEFTAVRGFLFEIGCVKTGTQQWVTVAKSSHLARQTAKEQSCYCEDRAIKVKKDAFCHDLSAIINVFNRGDIMLHLMAYQIPTVLRS